MSTDELKKKLKELGYHFKDWGFGIDVIRVTIEKRKLMIHGTVDEIVAWLKDEGEL